MWPGKKCPSLPQSLEIMSRQLVLEKSAAHKAPLFRGILQARILEWVAMSASRGFSPFRNQICVSYISCIAGRFFTTSATWEALKQGEMKVAQSGVTLCDPMGYTVQGILQARILEWVVFPFSRGSSQPRELTQVSEALERSKCIKYQTIMSPKLANICSRKISLLP